MENIRPRYTPGEIKDEDIVKIRKANGEIQEALNIEGLTVPVNMIKCGYIPDMRESIKKIRGMKCRHDDVFVCAYMRSGTHWVWEIANMLTTGKLEYSTRLKEAAMLEFNFPEEFDDFPSRRILNTNLPLRFLPTEVTDKKLKILFVQRNPKDVLVSSFHFLKKATMVPFTGDFNEYFSVFTKTGIMSNWFDHTREVEKAVQDTKQDIHTIYYEDLKRDPLQEIIGISKFLGTDCDTEFAEKVADLCSFEQMKTAHQEIKDISKFDYEEELIAAHFRKGEVGDWKRYFTVSQNEEFDTLFAEKMKDCTFSFEFCQ